MLIWPLWADVTFLTHSVRSVPDLFHYGFESTVRKHVVPCYNYKDTQDNQSENYQVGLFYVHGADSSLQYCRYASRDRFSHDLIAPLEIRSRCSGVRERFLGVGLPSVRCRA